MKSGKVPEHIKRSAAAASLLIPNKPIYVDKAWNATHYWVSPIKDCIRNVATYENGVCTWIKEPAEQE